MAAGSGSRKWQQDLRLLRCSSDLGGIALLPERYAEHAAAIPLASTSALALLCVELSQSEYQLPCLLYLGNAQLYYLLLLAGGAGSVGVPAAAPHPHVDAPGAAERLRPGEMRTHHDCICRRNRWHACGRPVALLQQERPSKCLVGAQEGSLALA